MLNKIYIYIRIALLLFFLEASAQQYKIDSLFVELKKEISLEKKVENLALISRLYRNIDLNRSKVIGDSIFNISSKANYVAGMGEGNYCLASYYLNNFDIEKSIASVKNAHYYFNKANNIEGITKCYVFYAIINFGELDYLSAFKNYFKAYNYAIESKDLTTQSMILYNIALIYNKIDDNKSALRFSDRSIEVATEANNDELIGFNVLLKGLIYNEIGSLKLALNQIYKSITYFKALENDIKLAMSYSLLADIKYKKNDLKSALFINNKALEIIEKFKEYQVVKADINYVFSKIYFKKNQNETALNYANKALDFYMFANNYKDATSLSRVIYSYYYTTPNVEAQFKFGDLFLEMNNKKYEIESKHLFSKVQIQLEEKNIELLKAKQEEKNIQVFIILVSSILFLISVVVVPLFYFKNKKLKATLATLNKSNKLKSNFISKIAHELNTPLNVIVGYSDLLNTTQLNTKLSELNNSIGIQSSFLLNMTQGLLNLNEVSFKNKIEVVNSSENLRKSILNLFFSLNQLDSFRNRTSINVDKNLDTCFNFDERKLHLVIQNLFNYMIQYSKMKHIKLDVRQKVKYKDDTEIDFNFFEYNHPSKLKTPLTSFKTIETASSDSYFLGLNLNLINLNLNLMQTELVFKTFNNEIDLLTFKLKLENCKDDSDVIISDITNKVEKITKILVVEDNELNMVLIKKMIQNMYSNVELIEAKNGKMSIEVFLNQNPDLILMDIQMPVMNGYEAAEEIRNTYSSNVPIIAVSASVFSENEENFKQAKMDKYIEKPLNSVLLKSFLDEYISI